METFHYLFNMILHLDQSLTALITLLGPWTYAILFFIIFSETGVLFLPFLPGDSLLFAAGTLSAQSGNSFNIHVLFILLATASVAGNVVNYFIGRLIGPHVFVSDHSLWLNKKHLTRAHAFYETYGGKTIVIARFIPIIRTFAPFVAGIASMNFRHFLFFNMVGTLLWVGGLLYASYWFGNIPAVQTHFSLIILAIIGLSLLPPIIELLRKKFLTSV